jgi:hypothetical protein
MKELPNRMRTSKVKNHFRENLYFKWENISVHKQASGLQARTESDVRFVVSQVRFEM